MASESTQAYLKFIHRDESTQMLCIKAKSLHEALINRSLTITKEVQKDNPFFPQNDAMVNMTLNAMFQLLHYYYYIMEFVDSDKHKQLHAQHYLVTLLLRDVMCLTSKKDSTGGYTWLHLQHIKTFHSTTPLCDCLTGILYYLQYVRAIDMQNQDSSNDHHTLDYFDKDLIAGCQITQVYHYLRSQRVYTLIGEHIDQSMVNLMPLSYLSTPFTPDYFKYNMKPKTSEPALRDQCPQQAEPLVALVTNILRDLHIPSIINSTDPSSAVSCKEMTPWLVCLIRQHFLFRNELQHFESDIRVGPIPPKELLCSVFKYSTPVFFRCPYNPIIGEDNNRTPDVGWAISEWPSCLQDRNVTKINGIFEGHAETDRCTHTTCPHSLTDYMFFDDNIYNLLRVVDKAQLHGPTIEFESFYGPATQVIVFLPGIDGNEYFYNNSLSGNVAPLLRRSPTRYDQYEDANGLPINPAHDDAHGNPIPHDITSLKRLFTVQWCIYTNPDRNPDPKNALYTTSRLQITSRTGLTKCTFFVRTTRKNRSENLLYFYASQQKSKG